MKYIRKEVKTNRWSKDRIPNKVLLSHTTDATYVCSTKVAFHALQKSEKIVTNQDIYESILTSNKASEEQVSMSLSC